MPQRVSVPGIEIQPAAARSEFVEANGVRLHYLDYGSEGKPPMLCVHGGGAHAHWFDFVAPGFIADYHVRAVDLRGHGDSAWAEPTQYNHEIYAQDLAELAERLDLRNFVLMGHSMGGLVALVYAAKRPPRLGRLVVVDSAMQLSQGRLSTLRDIGARGGRSYATLEELIARYRLLPDGTTSPREVVEYVARNGATQTPDGHWRHKFDRQVYATRKAVDGYLQFEHVEVPTLLVKASLSGRLTPEVVAQIKERCPLADLTEVAHSNHHVMLDNPTGLVDAVQAFLRKRTS